MVTLKEIYYQGQTITTQAELTKLLKNLLDTEVIGVQANEVTAREDNFNNSPLLSRSKWSKFGKNPTSSTIQLTEIINMPIGAWKEAGYKIGQSLADHHINVHYRSIFDLPVDRIRRGVFFAPITDRDETQIFLYNYQLPNGNTYKVPYFRITTLTNTGTPYREQEPERTGVQPIDPRIPVTVNGKRNIVFVNAMTEQYYAHQKMLSTFDLSSFSGTDYVSNLKKEDTDNQNNSNSQAVVDSPVDTDINVTLP